MSPPTLFQIRNYLITSDALAQNERTHPDFASREEKLEQYKSLQACVADDEKARLKTEITQLTTRIKVTILFALNLNENVRLLADGMTQLDVAAEMMREEIRQFHVDNMRAGTDEEAQPWKAP